MRRIDNQGWDVIDFVFFVYFRVLAPLFLLFALIAFPLWIADGVSLLINGQGIVEQLHNTTGCN